MKQVGNTILAKGVNHILAKRDNSAWPKGSKLSGFSSDSVNDETEIKHSDLTVEGRKFYSFGIIPWIRKIDRSRNPEKAIRDISFLEKKMVEFENL